MTTSISSPRPATRPVRRARRALLDLLFPPRCAGCGRRGVWLCPACAALTPPLAPPWCGRCGKPLPAPGRCRACRAGELPALDWARAAYPHAGPIRAAIHRFKYDGERARAEGLGLTLLPLLDALPIAARPARIVPVPLAPARRRERGYNQAEELARVLAAAGGWPLDTALVRTRATPPQVGLDRPARRDNVRAAFAWRGAPLAGTAVLLVDDVMTTGATAGECAATVRAAGTFWIGLVTVARASERDAPDRVG